MSGRYTYALLLAMFMSFMVSCSSEPLVREFIEEIEVEFEDEVFRQYCLDNFDYNGDGTLTNYEAGIVLDLDLSGENGNGIGITSLAGIEYFVRMRTLDCRGNQMTSLDVGSCRSLITLDCSGCGLTGLRVEGCGSLQIVDCSNNAFEEGAFNFNTLSSIAYLNCLESGVNQLLIPDTVRTLQYLYMGGTPAAETYIDFAYFPSLVELACPASGLDSIGTRRLTNLTLLECSSNNFTDTLRCGGLTSLRKLYSSSMERLPGVNVSGCTMLDTLVCYDNAITRLDLRTNTALALLVCSGNRLSSLDVSVNTQLTAMDCSRNTPPDININVWTAFDQSNPLYIKDPEATYVFPSDPDPTE